MAQNKDIKATKDEGRNDDSDNSAMQEMNATGENQNSQGQATFITGSTTGGGSNFGQGSSHLGGESYQQGSKLSTGANYDNESDGLGNSQIGTSHEGNSSTDSNASQDVNEDDAFRDGLAKYESEEDQQPDRT